MFNKPTIHTKKYKGLIFIFALLSVLMLAAVAKNIGVSDRAVSDDKYLRNLMQRSLVTTNPNLSPELIPPTNQWFSSLVFSSIQTAQPIFAWPLALKPTVNGFQLSQPIINSTADTVHAPFRVHLNIKTGDVKEQKVVHYDDLSVQFKQSNIDGNQTLIRIIRGSPFLFTTMDADQVTTIDAANSVITQRKVNEIIIQTEGVRFGVRANDGINITQTGSEIKARSGSQGGDLVLFALSEQASEDVYFETAANTVIKTQVETVIKNDTVLTTFTLDTKNNKETLFGLLSDNQTENTGQYGTFNTLEGLQIVEKGKTFKKTIHNIRPRLEIDVEKLTPVQKEEIKTYIQQEAETLTFQKNDTYFGGKELYRAAHLLKLAKQLGADHASSLIQPKLTAELVMWFDPKGYETRIDKYFYYDNMLKGIVGVKPAFGSQEFNDHHFHYGYFLDAVAILSEYDTEFMNSHREYVGLLAKDIANTDKSNKNFPYMRPFDQYSGHSWASGFGKFDDGQNQESSSEAVHAWEALYRWGKVTGSTELQNTALGLYNREAYAATNNWLSINILRPGFENYQHTIVPIVWSGKLDYATFFDPSAEAKLGIQLIPMSPGSNYIMDKAQVAKNLAAMYKETGQLQPRKFKDFLIMYESLANKTSAIEKLRNMQPTDIDEAMSKSYLYAFIYTQ